MSQQRIQNDVSQLMIYTDNLRWLAYFEHLLTTKHIYYTNIVLQTINEDILGLFCTFYHQNNHHTLSTMPGSTSLPTILLFYSPPSLYSHVLHLKALSPYLSCLNPQFLVHIRNLLLLLWSKMSKCKKIVYLCESDRSIGLSWEATTNVQ